MILILGYGNIGRALETALNHLKLKTHTIDFRNNGCDLVRNITEVPLVDSDFDGVEAVVSCLPYFLNFEIAKSCIDRDVPYIDLGGNVGVSQQIEDYGTPDSKIALDLGLAPGYVNVLALMMCDIPCNEVKDITMYCGGLSHQHYGPLNHACTWSFEGLINEYLDDCVILEDGKEKVVPGMDGYEILSVDGEEYEAFYTSGGNTPSVLQFKGTDKSIRYKTLRPVGYRKEFIKILSKMELTLELAREKYKLGQLDLGTLKNWVDYYEEEDKKDDYVVVYVVAKDDFDMQYTTYHHIENKNGLTAMQRATAFFVATVIYGAVTECHQDVLIPIYSNLLKNV